MPQTSYKMSVCLSLFKTMPHTSYKLSVCLSSRLCDRHYINCLSVFLDHGCTCINVVLFWRNILFSPKLRVAFVFILVLLLGIFVSQLQYAQLYSCLALFTTGLFLDLGLWWLIWTLSSLQKTWVVPIKWMEEFTQCWKGEIWKMFGRISLNEPFCWKIIYTVLCMWGRC